MLVDCLNFDFGTQCSRLALSLHLEHNYKRTIFSTAITVNYVDRSHFKKFEIISIELF